MLEKYPAVYSVARWLSSPSRHWLGGSAPNSAPQFCSAALEKRRAV